MNFKNVLLAVLPVVMLGFTSCSNDDKPETENITVLPLETPTIYEFKRADASTVAYEEQKNRILMLTDVTGYIGKGTSQQLDVNVLNGMYTNTGAFTNTALADVDPSIKLSDKTATSMGLFGGIATTESTAVQGVFTKAFEAAVAGSSPGAVASAGHAGIYTPTTGSKRLFSANGLEPSQVVSKGMMGAFLMDQVLNNFLSTKVLDAKNNRTNNANKVAVEGKNYTEMEHAWDQAYGLIYSADDYTTDPAKPALKFWSSYIKQVNDQNAVFGSLQANILNAFIKGRAAIVANDYAERDRQITIIKENFSKIPAIRGVHYMYEAAQAGKTGFDAFHGLSEGYGFIMSLRFTNDPTTNQPYFTKAEVDGFLSDLSTGTTENPGLYDVNNLSARIDVMTAKIAAKFGFTVEDAKLGK